MPESNEIVNEIADRVPFELKLGPIPAAIILPLAAYGAGTIAGKVGRKAVQLRSRLTTSSETPETPEAPAANAA